jgi:APA family basic amino acid/polyamine antiporter
MASVILSHFHHNSSMTKRPSVFVREATGLVRQFSGWDSFAVQFGGDVVVVALATLFVVTTYLPGADLLVALLMMLPVLVFYFITVTQIGVAMPRSGGDYVFISRALNPAVGMAEGWISVFLLILNPAIFSGLIVTGFMPGLLTAIGIGVQATWLTDLGVQFVLDNIIIALSFMLVIIPIGKFSRAQTVLILLSILGAIVVPLSLLALGHGGFVSAINARSTLSYDSVISKAQSLGFKPQFSWVDTVLAVPGLCFYLLTLWPLNIGGEIKNVKKSMPIGLIGGTVVAWVLFFITAAAYYDVVGRDFASSIAFLATNSPESSPFGSNVLLTSVLQYVYGLSVPTFLISIGLVAACFIVIAQSVLVATRYVLAWAFDNIMPSKLASVSDRFGTPVTATLVLWIISEIVLIVQLLWSSAIAIWLNAGIMVIIFIMTVTLAATFVSRRRKDLLELSPSLVRRKFGGFYLITISGAISTIALAAFLICVIAFPQVGYPVTPANVAFMILVYVLGAAVYYVAKYYRKRQGMDLELTFKQVPPE